MEKDLFELMTKMYSEMQGGFERVNSEITGIKSDITDIKVELKYVKSEVKKINLSIENDIKPNIQALFDGYVQNTESVNRIEDELRELRISINNLNIKTLKNENNILSFSKRLLDLNNAKH